MGFHDAPVILKIRVVLLSVILFVQILGLALPYWLDTSDSVEHRSIGLWKACSSVAGCFMIENFEQVPDWWAATRALEIIGLLFATASLGLTIYVMNIVNEMRSLKLIGSILSFVACGCIIIGIIIFGAKVKVKTFSGAFAITIIAGISCFVDGGLAITDWRRARPV